MAEKRSALRLGTRTSQLAMVQTEMVQEMLATHLPGLQIEVVGITTRGDRQRTVPIPELGQGAFVKELEAALMLDEIDIAVHSLKDLPSTLPPGLTLAAVPPRGDPRDALVSRDGHGLASLPKDARVGTGSPRRVALVKSMRPDVELVPLRGNVDTRLRKVLVDNEVDAAVLAATGLQRLGRDDTISELLDPVEFLPAVGQAFLGIECRADDAATIAYVTQIEDPLARVAADAERAFLAAMGSGCKAPLAAFARDVDGVATLDALVSSLDGETMLRERMGYAGLSRDEIGQKLKGSFFARGAEALIAAADDA